VRQVGYAAFTLLALVLTAIFAVGIYATVTDEDHDTPEAAARKAECRKLVRHYFELSGAGQVDEAAAKVPIEDIEQCGAAHSESVACMIAATRVEAMHSCIPVPVECRDGRATVTGDHPINEVGECSNVTVTGSHVTVIGKSVDTLAITGSDNTIRVASTKKLDDRGERNKIIR